MVIFPIELVKGLLVIFDELLSFIWPLHTVLSELVCFILPSAHRKNRANTNNLTCASQKRVRVTVCGNSPADGCVSLLRHSIAIFDTSTLLASRPGTCGTRRVNRFLFSYNINSLWSSPSRYGRCQLRSAPL